MIDWQNYIKYILPDEARKQRNFARNARRHRDECSEAGDWVSSYEENYSKILGTLPGENDCLIPSSDQFFDVNDIGGIAIDTDTGIYKQDHKFNHIEEMSHPEIWGDEGRLSRAKVGDDCLLNTWLDYALVDVREGVTIK